MRKLLYVPIIHMEPDLGSVAASIGELSRRIYGEARWNKHRQTVTMFWNAISDYFDSLDVSGFKIYQDGLLANGELGLKIIREGAARGSRNHEIVLKMVERGAEIKKTEDVTLLKEEYERIVKLSQSKSFLGMGLAYLQYKMRKNHLTRERDGFIARMINGTLGQEKEGVLFIGAFHEVGSLLSQDIVVKEIKAREKVRAYFEELVRGKDEERFDELSEYLAAPVSIRDC